MESQSPTANTFEEDQSDTISIHDDDNQIILNQDQSNFLCIELVFFTLLLAKSFFQFIHSIARTESIF